ncbi:MAG: hypothetical protein KA771_06275 [Spirochaetales bacterium]|nr:hypothetical protein [Spirochaetales bacterium]
MKEKTIQNRLWGLVAGVILFVGCATTQSTKTDTAPAPGVTPKGEEKPAELDVSTYQKPGFAVATHQGRLWVFKEGSKEYEKFKSQGEPAYQVTKVGALPGGITVKAPDTVTLYEYLTYIPGFFNKMVDDRLWIFKADSKELEEFKQSGEPARQVVRPAGGPFEITLKGPGTEILDEYMSSWEKAQKAN